MVLNIHEALFKGKHTEWTDDGKILTWAHTKHLSIAMFYMQICCWTPTDKFHKNEI